jgi:hypothetical protein
MKKIILWSLVAALIASVAVGAFLWSRKPQVIIMSNGTKLTLLGVTYGKHHIALANGRSARMDSTNDTVVVWILQEHKPNQWPNYELMVYDTANTACVSAWSRNSTQIKDGMEVQGFMLEAYPRWDKKMILRIMSWGNGGQHVSKDQFIVSNPARSSAPQWATAPLPETQSDDDLDVTLTKLIANAPAPYNRGNGAPRTDPINRCVQFDFDVQQNSQSATNWRPVRAEISDAAGNQVKGWVNGYHQNGESSVFFQPTLWPDEPAWKLRLEFSRTSGFKGDEIWTVTNLPVQLGSQQDIWNNWNSEPDKPAFAETTINGTRLKIFPAVQFKDQNQGGDQSVNFIIRADPDPETNGNRLTLISVANDQGRILENRNSSWGSGTYQFGFPNVRNSKTLNVTVALHQSRFVEFTVKPTKASTANGP